MRGLALGFALALSTAMVAPGHAADPGNDVWHFIDTGDRLFREDRADLSAAGIIQSDGRIARLYLVPGEDGAVVSVTLPDTDQFDTLISVLRLRSGVFSRRVDADALLVSQTPEGATYSFAISKDDIELFMAARDWQLRLGNDSHTISLSGSRKAIAEAIERMSVGSDAGGEEPADN